jgi:hypothetical protein
LEPSHASFSVEANTRFWVQSDETVTLTAQVDSQFALFKEAVPVASVLSVSDRGRMDEFRHSAVEVLVTLDLLLSGRVVGHGRALYVVRLRT